MKIDIKNWRIQNFSAGVEPTETNVPPAKHRDDSGLTISWLWDVTRLRPQFTCPILPYASPETVKTKSANKQV